MTYATVEKPVWLTITEEDIKNINKDGEIEMCAWVDVDMSDYDDDDIQSEYEERFNFEGPDPAEWRRLYEQRRSMSVDDFLKIVDNLIMNNTGRIL